ncbi:MAG: hypothetical protein AAB727_02625 [Patescibacteria group bacterium]
MDGLMALITVTLVCLVLAIFIFFRAGVSSGHKGHGKSFWLVLVGFVFLFFSSVGTYMLGQGSIHDGVDDVPLFLQVDVVYENMGHVQVGDRLVVVLKWSGSPEKLIAYPFKTNPPKKFMKVEKEGKGYVLVPVE